MSKRTDNKKKPPTSGPNLKSDKTKVDVQERQTRLREEQALQAQKNEESMNLEHQVIW